MRRNGGGQYLRQRRRSVRGRNMSKIQRNRKNDMDKFIIFSNTILLIIVDMVKVCEHLLNLKLEKIANYFSKCQFRCTGNKNHFNAFLDICLSCGQTRCVNFESIDCSYQHSYGTKHPLVFREKEKIVYCFGCQQNLTELIGGNDEKENSNGKLEKIVEAHQRVIEFSTKLAERFETFSVNPP